MVMLRQLQNSFNRFIERFQDRWETQPSFRATWSIIGCAFAIVFLCSSLLVSLNIANAITGGGKTTANANDNVLYAGGNGDQPTHQVEQSTPNVTTTPNANPIATSNAATPTPTVSPTPFGGTPGATTTPGNGTPAATATTNVTVTAQQQPNPWTPTGTNTITNVATSPQAPNGHIDFKLDFGCKQIDVQGQLDGNGTAQTIQQQVNIPGCFKNPASQQISASVTIDGQQAQFSQPFYAKGQ